MNKVRESKNAVCSTMFNIHRTKSDIAESDSMLKVLGGIIIQKVNDQKDGLTPKSDKNSDNFQKAL